MPINTWHKVMVPFCFIPQIPVMCAFIRLVATGIAVIRTFLHTQNTVYVGAEARSSHSFEFVLLLASLIFSKQLVRLCRLTSAEYVFVFFTQRA